MTTLTTYKTASGKKITLTKARGVGHVEISVDGKFVGMMDCVKSHATHGNVITIKGCAAMIAIPADSLAAVNAGIELMHKIDAETAAHTAAKIAQYLASDEGQSETLMARIHAHDDAGGRDRSERF